METLKNVRTPLYLQTPPASPLSVSSHFSACVARVKKGRGITPTTPSKMQNNSCYSLLKLFLNFFVHSLLFFSPGLPFPQSNRRKNYPSCPLISIESFFPGWKHCHPFSLHSLPFPLFISVKWLPQGETELGNNMRQVSQEESSHKKKKKILLLYPLYPSTYPFFSLLYSLVPSHNPTHTLHPHAN